MLRASVEMKRYRERPNWWHRNSRAQNMKNLQPQHPGKPEAALSMGYVGGILGTLPSSTAECPAYGQWKDRRVDHLLGSPAKPTGKYVITVHTKEAAAENGIRSRKAGREKEKASKNSRRCCFQNTDWRHYEMPHKCHRRRLQMKVHEIQESIQSDDICRDLASQQGRLDQSDGKVGAVAAYRQVHTNGGKEGQDALARAVGQSVMGFTSGLSAAMYFLLSHAAGNKMTFTSKSLRASDHIKAQQLDDEGLNATSNKWLEESETDT
ncbi:MAG: hypothetical protein FRX49_11138 [Trebouxia sp. A1-2]|nr:MAG: hypothetical protein FRX49_11138 [Trebouxia sp. A1-2]